MAKTIDLLLDKYGESHQNATNKLIHWVCVPLIFFSIVGLIFSIPFPLERTLFFNWAGLVMLLALIYYLRLSVPLAAGFLVYGFLCLFFTHTIFESVGRDAGQLALIMLTIFVLAWIGQFIGHKIEGKKPSFFQDLQFLLIGPAWLLHFIYRNLGIKY